jgi:hypothetical protein
MGFASSWTVKTDLDFSSPLIVLMLVLVLVTELSALRSSRLTPPKKGGGGSSNVCNSQPNIQQVSCKSIKIFIL